MKETIVKGGERFYIGPLSYRKGYDIVKTEDNKYFLSVMNGPFRIFEGPKEDTIKKAERRGIIKMKKEKPQLARNIGVR